MLCVEIKQSDWMLQVTRLVLTYHLTALFKVRIVKLAKHRMLIKINDPFNV